MRDKSIILLRKKLRKQFRTYLYRKVVKIQLGECLDEILKYMDKEKSGKIFELLATSNVRDVEKIITALKNVYLNVPEELLIKAIIKNLYGR